MSNIFNNIFNNLLNNMLRDFLDYNSTNLLLLCLAIHSLFCLIFFGINIKKNGLQDSIYKFIIVFFLPIFGFLYFGISNLVNKFIKKSEENIESYLRYIHQKGHIYYEEPVDFESEINTIPLIDNLQFSDNKNKRAYLLYLLKKDFSGHINGLKEAIKSDDSETSHYAAAAMMEIKKQFEYLILSHKENYELDKNNIQKAKKYADVLRKYLRSGIADRVDYFEYLNKYSDLLAFLVENYKSEEIYFSEKVLADLELNDLKSAYKFCKQYLDSFPDSENAYILLLKVLCKLKDYESFRKELKKIENKFKNKIYEGKLYEILQYWKDYLKDELKGAERT